MIENQFIQAFSSLNISFLNNLHDDLSYSYNNKDEIINELKEVFKKINSTGINKLNVKKSNCKFCYPKGKAYSFHNPKTDELVIRYVIFKENDIFYRVEECKNKPIPDGKNGLPF